jgi:hypothetical protein
MNDPLGKRLLERLKRGEAGRVLHATAADLGKFNAQPSKCHDNVNRWCAENPHHRPVRGWAVTSTLFDKHSIIDRGADGFLDITPIRDRSPTLFLGHDEADGGFESLPNQVISIDLDGNLSPP